MTPPPSRDHCGDTPRGSARPRNDHEGRWDAVVVGAGHNGLVCAAYLARAGLRVIVLESRSVIGGCAGTVDALGSARVNVCNCDHTMIRTTAIADELDLAAHGLTYLEVDPTQIGAGWDGGTPWVSFRDPERTLDALSVTHPDAVAGYRRYLDAALPAARLLLALTGGAPTPGGVLRRVAGLRGRGAATLLAWSRRSVGSVLASYFPPGLAGAVMTTGPAVWGVGPDTPGTGLGALGPAVRHLVGVGRPVGGSGALPDAVARSFVAAGGVVRTGAAVREIVCEGDRTRGVRLASGEVVDAPVVISSVDPRRTLVTWLARPPVSGWADRPVHDGYESKIDAVVSRPPRILALTDELLERLGLDPAAALLPTTIVAPPLPDIAAAHRLLASGRVAERPMFFANVPSALDPTMVVPEPAGGHVLSLEVLWTPYALAGGWAGSAEPARWLDAFRSLVGDLDVRRWRVVTPVDYERDLGLERGWAPSFSGGPLAALLGRDRELTRYATPVRGLYLTGAGTFPGAGVWGAAGRNAAHVVLTARP